MYTQKYPPILLVAPFLFSVRVPSKPQSGRCFVTWPVSPRRVCLINLPRDAHRA